MHRKQALEILTQHQAEIENFGVKFLAIFGSVARDTAQPDSDVDILAPSAGSPALYAKREWRPGKPRRQSGGQTARSARLSLTRLLIALMKVVKLRIYPTKEQEVALAKAFGCCRLVWNRSLQLTTEAYRQTGKGISGYDLKKMLPQWKRELEWLGETYSQCLQSSVLNLSRAFVNFFEGRARYPRFKSKHKRQSLQYPQNVKLEGDKLHLPKIGEVYCRVHRWFEGTIKTVTVSRNTDGRYHASILIDDGSDKPEPNPDGKAVGIDMGLKHFTVTSNGKKYNNPRHLKKHERNLKRKQRKLSRKQQGSNSRQKARRLVARVHSKIANSRADFLHKLSRKIVNENPVIVVENLAVKNMVKNHSLAKAISDVGWGMFSTMLKYKAEGEGKVYLEVDRFFPSTHNPPNPPC